MPTASKDKSLAISNRLAAARVLRRVMGGESLSNALPEIFKDIEEGSEPVVQALVYGAIRQHEKISIILTLLLRSPLRKKDSIVDALLRIALFECLEEKTADYAVVNEMVKLVGKQRSWARGLANACLRRFLREKDSLLEQSEKQSEAFYCLPEWLLQRIQLEWPDEWQQIAEATKQHPPMVLRVNTSKLRRSEYMGLLKEKKIPGFVHPAVSTAVVLKEAMPVKLIPGFDQGMVSIQGASSQLAAGLLDLAKGQRVLDACAAPGGKTLHILQACEVELTALDKQAERLEKLHSNLQRGGMQAKVVVATAEVTESWWDGECFDRILLDAPCSATGVIRKHPDIKLHRTSDDIVTLARQQQSLLNALWNLLKPGGKLLYSTCSIMHAENEDQIDCFLQSRASFANDACIVPLKIDMGITLKHGVQILPGDNDMDGFYYALLEKSIAG